MRYTLTFTGRRAGAIGISEWHSITVEVATPRKALLQAYATHEHIHHVTMTEHRPGPLIDGRPSVGVAVVVPPEEYGR